MSDSPKDPADQAIHDTDTQHMFYQASNFELHQPVFSTGTVNVFQAPTQTTKQANIADVLQCPSPSQYFVGRDDTLRQLARIFSAPVVSIWSPNLHTLHDFVRQNFKHKSLIFLDASSGQALDQTYADMLKNQEVSAESLLVLENADPSLVLEDHLPTLSAPKLITSTDEAIGNWTLHTDNTFHLVESANHKAVNKLVRSIEKSLNRGQLVTTIVANGGSGKTQVVLEFIATHTSIFSNIWFFDASSDATLSANFKELGEAIGCGEDIKDVSNFLGRSHHNWMCIFDNADDGRVDLENYIPRCNHGNIIVTSRLAEISQINSPGCFIEFGDLDEKSAIELLLKHTHSGSSEMNVNSGSKIVTALGCHALAVSTAGAYIHANATCTLANYLTRFNKKRREVLMYKKKALDQYQRSIYSTFQLSFEQLSYQTQFLMQICSHFHPIAIPMEIFTRAVSFTGSDTEAADLDPPMEGLSLMMKFLDLFRKDGTWDDSIDELCKLSLGSYEDCKKTLSFHKIIHTCFQENVTYKECMMQAALLLFARAIPRGWTQAEYEFRRHLFVHASHLQMARQPTISLKNGLALILSDNGRLEQAQKLQEEVLLLRKEILGEHHPNTLTSMVNLASTYSDCGKLDLAENLMEEVLLLSKKILGEHHPNTLTSMANLALTYNKCGKLMLAEKLQEEALLQRKEILGEHHSDTLNSMANLASTYRHCGKLEFAEKLEEEVLLLRKEILGEHHPHTLISMANLASTCRHRGKLKSAEKLEEEVLLLSKEILGEHHLDTLTSMANLALTYKHCGKLELAEKLGEEALLLRKKMLGEHHPDTLTSMSNLASTYNHCGKLELAERLQEEVLLLMKKILRKNHPETLTSMANLALTYKHRGKLQLAEKLEEEVLLLMKEILGEHHPDTLISMDNLASTYRHCGKLELAEKLQEEALLLSKKILGEHHPDTLTTMANLASTYSHCGKLGLGEKLEKEVLLLRKEILGEHHPDTLISMGNLALIYNHCGELELAEQLEEEVLFLRKTILGEHHPHTLTSMANLAIIYRNCGKLESSQKLGEEVLSLRKRILGEQHPDTLASKASLALTELTEKLEEKK